MDSCRNQRSQQIKYLQIENEKLRMDLNNETTHGKKLERTVEDLNNRLLDAQNQLRITESKMASRYSDVKRVGIMKWTVPESERF